MIRKIIGMTLFTSLLVAAVTIQEGFAGLAGIIDLPSLLLVVGLTTSATIWSFDLQDIIRSFKNSCSSQPLSESEALMGCTIFQKMAEYALGSGMIGTLIGVVKMLQDMSDPTAIGPAMAVALLTLLYGILFGEIVFKSMATDLLRRHHTHLERNSQRGRIHTYAALLTLILLVGSVFTIMVQST